MAKGEGGGWRPGGGSGPVRRGPKADWMPTAQKPKSRSRQVKIAALILLFLALIGAVVVLYYYLSPPSPPVLLIITTDPSADAPDLHAPIDPYGWMSAKDLAKWSARNRESSSEAERNHAPVASDGSDQLRNNDTIKSEADLAEWALGETRHAGRLRKPSETAILYFGLHTGADSNGPFLYANKGRRFKVDALLQAISEKLGKTKVLVLFDPCRQLPEPTRGVLHDGFVQAMKAKEMSETLARLDNITVILGCDEGERAWESEELKRTAFAHALIEGLGGKASPTRDQYLTALDLYKSVKGSVQAWSMRNRPTSQNPVLLPLGEVGERRAFGTTLMLHHATEDGKPTAHDPLPGLTKRWEEYGKLAMVKRPGPEVYAPRHWRRYRELLLRYEHAARSGEIESANAVDRALDVEAGGIRAAQAAAFIGRSRTASGPMWQASGQPPAIDKAYDSELRGLGDKYLEAGTEEPLGFFRAGINRLPDHRTAYSDQLLTTVLKALPGDPTVSPDALKRRARLLRAMWESEPVRPPDVQLFLMLQQFSDLQGGEAWPSEKDENGTLLWQRALLVRRAAEEAALGPVSDAHPYSEAVWRTVKDVVKSADASRRRAEDLLFALEADRKPAFVLLDAAGGKYGHARKRAEAIRDALALRDEVMADLPFLGRWAVFEGEDRYDAKPVLKLWADVHALAEALDKLPPESADGDSVAIPDRYAELERLHGSVRKAYTTLADRYGDSLLAESRDPKALQNAWLVRERLLLVPPSKLKADRIALERRAEIVRANRRATQLFAAAENKTATGENDARQRLIARKDRAVALGHLALSGLGKTLIDDQKVEDVKLSGWDAIGEEVIKINDKSWAETAAAGDRLLRHYSALANRTDPPASDPKAAEAERFSRSAVLPQLRDGDEPAVINRNFRWQALFAGQAHRAVLDHWYDEPESTRPRYFKNVAQAFEENAKELAPAPDLSRPGEKTAAFDIATFLGAEGRKEYQDLLNADTLKLAAAADTTSWTTELDKQVTFALTSRALPPDAAAVGWAAFDKENKERRIGLKARTWEREVLALKSESTKSLFSTLVPPEGVQSIRESATVRRIAFLRGQVHSAESTVHLRRAPDVIATHVRQQTDPPRVAFVGANDIDVGAVTIVIDYSPSMTELTDPNNKTARPRIQRTWVELRKILLGLPKDTRLSVRGFGLAPKAGQEVGAKYFDESVITKGGVDPDDLEKYPYPGTHDRSVFDAPIIVKWDEANQRQLNDIMQLLETAPQQKEEKKGREGINSPVVRTMLRSFEHDFKDVGPHQTRILIVLTDGGDNSGYDFKNRTNPISHRKSLEALQKSLKSGDGNGVTVRVLLINDDDTNAKDREVTETFRKEVEPILKAAEPPGSVRVEKVEILADELRELLRPRVRMSDSNGGKPLPELPIQFDSPAGVWERPKWSPPLPDKEYESWVGKRPPDATQLKLADADRMLVKLTRPDFAKPVKFERALWGRYGRFGDALRQADRVLKEPVDNWLVSIPRYRGTTSGYQGEYQEESGRYNLDLTAAVEHTRTDGQLLRQPAPAFAWWELNADGPVRSPDATVHLWREYKNPAPSWRIRRWNWIDASTTETLPKGSLSGWVETRDGQLRERHATTLDAVGEAWASAGGGKDDGRIWQKEWDCPECTVRFSWEPHTFALDPDVPEPEKQPRLCLAVRIYSKKKDRLPDGKKVAPYFVQMDSTLIEEHRYFREVGAYTGYFVLKGTPPDAATGRRVRLYSVADLTDPKTGTALVVPLPGKKASDIDPVWNSWSGWEPLLVEPPKTP